MIVTIVVNALEYLGKKIYKLQINIISHETLEATIENSKINYVRLVFCTTGCFCSGLIEPFPNSARTMAQKKSQN